MSAHILQDYKETHTTHSASDDLESLVYVLIWMCMLYAGPGTPCEDVRIVDTVLRPWVTVTNAIDAVNLEAIKQGMKFWPSNVTDKFTPYFKPLCLVVEKLLVELRGWLSSNDTDDRPHYKAIRNILLEGFGTVAEVPNWSGAKDVFGYGLLQRPIKRKAPSWVTVGHGDREKSSKNHHL